MEFHLSLRLSRRHAADVTTNGQLRLTLPRIDAASVRHSVIFVAVCSPRRRHRAISVLAAPWLEGGASAAATSQPGSRRCCPPSNSVVCCHCPIQAAVGFTAARRGQLRTTQPRAPTCRSQVLKFPFFLRRDLVVLRKPHTDFLAWSVGVVIEKNVDKISVKIQKS
ncbi:hypothetical protein AAHA92_00484 [Salvia divinorum]|uniref:Uncharacterized protein n=1 Tax=Salvia divinorum TaxID=28513 RepID=A0ABD1IJQ7_SALDI